MMHFIDSGLNHITMYRLVLYYLLGLLGVALGFSFFQLVPGGPLSLAFSAAVITAACWAVNRVFAASFKVPVNTESVYITAAILALIMPTVQVTDGIGIAGLVLASAAAVASKFVLSIRRRHVFNPVAIGIVASAYLLDQPATWWAGSSLAMLSFVVIGGVLVARKVQRLGMLGAYLAASVATTLVTTSPDMYGEAAKQLFIYSPLLFAGFAMLTEPLTAPAGYRSGLIYGAIVGALATPNVHFGDFYLTPEIGFLAGNLFAFAMAPQGRFKLTLLRVEKLAAGCYNFVFETDRKPKFHAGQYLDWTLDVVKPDSRGNRRSFTIASAPHGDEVHLGVKFYKNPSAFKKSLLNMKQGSVIYASQVAGEFTLPRDRSEKLAFIAGGIGVTPFSSMMQDMINKRESRPVVMLYGNNTAREIAYAGVFDKAERELGIRTVYAIADGTKACSNMHPGFIDKALIQKEVPDFRERTFYISGPRAMVLRFKDELKSLGVSRSRIRIDYFPGFA